MRPMLLLLALLTTTAHTAHTQSTLVNIQRAFYVDAQQHPINPQALNTVIDTLSWKVDFNRLHKNDKFLIIGSNKQQPDAIFFKRNKQTIQAFLWRGEYYDKNGQSLQSGFLKAPLKYQRISSGFQLRRFHPILKTYLPHRAIDYAAPYGTKVHAIADGVIEKRQHIGALGNTIFIKHGGYYQSVYAHLSKFVRSLKIGKRVKKGQVIGYVGSSGRSTGPHLHFEIRHRGKRLNPLSYNPPEQQHVAATELADFHRKIQPYLNLK